MCVLILGVIALFAVAVLAQGHARWYPQGDLAMTELHVRDVGSLHPPLLGLVGRIGTATKKGSHLGPVSFYALWPFYEVFGARAWSLIAATACLNAIAAAAALWIARRRGGLGLTLGVCAVIVALMAFLGPSIMTQPWNPYLPVLWWLVFVLSVWSVMCDDVVLLALAAFSGSFCAQTHISYAVLIAASAVLVIGSLCLRMVRGDPSDRRRILRVVAVSGAVSLVLWLPPLYQQLTARDGNVGQVLRYFSHPPLPAIGLGEGLHLMMVHLNPWTVVSSHSALTTTGSPVPGVLMVIAWIGSVIVAWRLRDNTLLRLHAVVALTLIVGVWSMSQIFGFVWYYVVLWAWCICGLVVVAIVWSVHSVALRFGAFAKPASSENSPARILMLVIIVVLGMMFLRDSLTVQVPPSAASNTVARELVQPTLATLRRGVAPGSGRYGTYLVTYDDPVLLGSQAFTLVNELDRAGLHVGMLPVYERYVGSSRSFGLDRATAIVHLAVGADIQHWERTAGAYEIVEVDPRTARERKQFNLLVDRLRSQLSAAGLSGLVPMLQTNLFGAMDDKSMPVSLRPMVAELIQIGLPEAVFVITVLHAKATGSGDEPRPDRPPANLVSSILSRGCRRVRGRSGARAAGGTSQPASCGGAR